MNTNQLINEVYLNIQDKTHTKVPLDSMIEIINSIQQEICTAAHFPFLKQSLYFWTIGPYSKGTVAVTVSPSKTIIGTNTEWTSALIGQYFTVLTDKNIYKVMEVVSATELTLDTAFHCEKDASGLSYQIWPKFFDLPSDFVKENNDGIKLGPQQKILKNIPDDLFDHYVSDITATGEPDYYAIMQKKTKIEFFPVPDKAYQYNLCYIRRIPDISKDKLDGVSEIPTAYHYLIVLGSADRCRPFLPIDVIAKLPDFRRQYNDGLMGMINQEMVELNIKSEIKPEGYMSFYNHL